MYCRSSVEQREKRKERSVGTFPPALIIVFSVASPPSVASRALPYHGESCRGTMLSAAVALSDPRDAGYGISD